MKIEQYISQLLYRHQCVIVPGFGAFLTEIHSAHLHENTNSFYPPKKVISFSSQLKNNDGLLANHIALMEKLSYNNAVTMIESEVIIWKSILEVNHKFSMKNIGDLTLNSEKSLVFTPSESVNYLTSSFGLNSYVSPLIKREALQNLVEEKIEIEEDKEVVALNSTINKGRSYLKYAAVFVVSLTGAGIFGYQMMQNKVQQETLLVETTVQKEVQNKIQEATFLIENPLPSVSLALKEEKYSYHIVAGAFRNQENAQKAFLDLLSNGYKARRIAPNKHGLFPVLYGSYPNKAEAQKALAEIHQTVSQEAWLLVKEL